MKSRLSQKAGAAVRKLRLAKGWTLAQLAERSTIPLSTLSKVELGQTSLSYDKLMRICKALEIDLERLVDAEAEAVSKAQAGDASSASGRRSVIRAQDGALLDAPIGRLRAAAHDLLGKPFTPVIAEVRARSIEDCGGYVRREGEAYALVLDGAMVMHSELYAPLRLVRGDAVYFDAGMAHAFLADGAEPCRALIVLSGDHRQ